MPFIIKLNQRLKIFSKESGDFWKSPLGIFVYTLIKDVLWVPMLASQLLLFTTITTSFFILKYEIQRRFI